PPVEATVVEYPTPTCPFGSVSVEIASAALIVTTYDLVDVPVIASVTVMLTLKVPDAVGVPVIAPDPSELIDRPAGNPVCVHVYGAVPPVRVICVAVYNTPDWPTGSDAGPE